MIVWSTILGVALLLSAVAVWNALAWPRVGRATVDESHRVSVLIPARDEEENLPACLESVLNCGPVVGEVLVYDDHSSDGTAQCIDQFATADARVRRLAPVPLEPGWTGKSFACSQLAKQASERWWLFLDADARISPNAPGLAVAEAIDRDATLISCWPGLKLESPWERLLMPLLNFVVLTLFPAPLSFRRSDPSLGVAHGAFILVDGEVYREVGGHERVREEIFEDTRLAQVWRASGRRSLCLDGQDAVSVRMYSSFRGIWEGFLKNFRPAFRSPVSFWAFIALHLYVFLAPFLAIPIGLASGTAWGIAAAAALTVLLARISLALRFGHPFWSALLHPVGEAVLIGCGIRSWWLYRTGTGVAWKGRRYAAPADVANDPTRQL